MAVVLVGLGATVWPGSPQWVVLAGFSVAAAFGLPLLVAGSPATARRILPVAVGVVAVLAALAGWARATGDLPARDREHDGGVIVTRAAASEIRHGRNPYTADFGPLLPESWQLVQGTGGELVENPVRDHFPYLPAAALVHVPFVVAADAVGQTWDPRILGWAAVVAAMVVVARRPEPAWARLGAVLGVGSAFAIIYLSWGTNDPFAAALAVVALALADRAPGWAGVALAVAVSAKLLLAVLVPPLALVVWLTGGAAGLRRWWTFPAVLAATVVPALLAIRARSSTTPCGSTWAAPSPGCPPRASASRRWRPASTGCRSPCSPASDWWPPWCCRWWPCGAGPRCGWRARRPGWRCWPCWCRPAPSR
jgi:hypothetical protein